MKITMAHGSGGRETSELINGIFAQNFGNSVLSKMEDSAVVPVNGNGCGKIAMTTDSFVVTPLFFKGGDIGRLSVCGTVNDLLMSGAVPKYLTCGFILEEGADTEDLEKIARSMQNTAEEAGVMIVAGDTKVIEGNGGIYINTSGVGFLKETMQTGADKCKSGDVILLSGNLGDHHAAILSARMEIENQIKSDCAPLGEMVGRMQKEGVEIHTMRDVTRGGLATVLNEISDTSGCGMNLQEERIPVSKEVKAFCNILGLDPFYMGNEGKMIAIVKKEHAQLALSCMRESRYGKDAAIIGEVTGSGEKVTVETALGGKRILTVLYGEGLPRIC